MKIAYRYTPLKIFQRHGNTKFNKLEEINQCLEKHKLPKLTEDEIIWRVLQPVKTLQLYLKLFPKKEIWLHW